MTSPSERPAAGPDCTAVADEFARRLPELDLESLRALLQALQFRLGTDGEQPCDLERAQVLGHEINNRVTPGRLRESLRQLGLPPPPPAS